MHAAIVFLKLLIFSLLSVVGVVIVILIFWGLFPYQPNQARLSLVQTDDRLSIQDHDRYLSLTPRLNQRDVALVFYPGGVIDSQAYLHRLSVAAQAGVSVFVTKPKLHLAATDSEVFRTIQQDHPQIHQWFIGGHSLGGIVGCWYLKHFPDQIRGLVLMASYCLDDISQLPINVLSLSGDADLLITDQTEMSYQSHLPASATVIHLADFNHSDFGDYESANELPAHLSDAAIQNTLRQYLVPFLLQQEASAADRRQLLVRQKYDVTEFLDH